MLRRAKFLFTAAGGVIFISLLLDVFVPDPNDPRLDWWIWNEHPHVLVVLLMLSSGLCVATAFQVFQSKGDGRWVLKVGAPGMAALSILGAIGIGQSI